MNRYTCITRHSERIDMPSSTQYDPRTIMDLKQSWSSSQRYRENKYDPPLTDHGKHCAEEEAVTLIKHLGDDIMPFTIISSPFTRCVETAGAIQHVLRYHYGEVFPIGIEYGLAEPVFQHTIPIWDGSSRTFSFQNVPVDNNENNMDEKMKPSQYERRFPHLTFDRSYSSIQSFVPRRIENLITFGNRIVQITDQLVRQQPPNTYLICVGHADTIRFAYNYYIGRPLSTHLYNRLYTDQGYGACILLKNKKPIAFYSSNREYCAGLPDITYQQYSTEQIKNILIIFLCFACIFFIYKTYLPDDTPNIKSITI